MSTNVHPKEEFSRTKVSTRCHPFCQREVTYYVHEMSATHEDSCPCLRVQTAILELTRKYFIGVNSTTAPTLQPRASLTSFLEVVYLSTLFTTTKFLHRGRKKMTQKSSKRTSHWAFLRAYDKAARTFSIDTTPAEIFDNKKRLYFYIYLDLRPC